MKEGRKKKKERWHCAISSFLSIDFARTFSLLLCVCVSFIYIYTYFFFRRLFREVSFFSSYICNACHASSELIIAVFLCETSTASKEGKRGQTARQGCRFTPVVSHHRLINPCSTHIICRYTHTHKKKKRDSLFSPLRVQISERTTIRKKKRRASFFFVLLGKVN